MLSQAEMQDMPRGKGMFAQLDTDSDGAISAEEFAARKGGHGMRFGKGHGMHGGMGHGMNMACACQRGNQVAGVSIPERRDCFAPELALGRQDNADAF